MPKSISFSTALKNYRMEEPREPSDSLDTMKRLDLTQSIVNTARTIRFELYNEVQSKVNLASYQFKRIPLDDETITQFRQDTKTIADYYLTAIDRTEERIQNYADNVIRRTIRDSSHISESLRLKCTAHINWIYEEAFEQFRCLSTIELIASAVANKNGTASEIIPFLTGISAFADNIRNNNLRWTAPKGVPYPLYVRCQGADFWPKKPASEQIAD